MSAHIAIVGVGPRGISITERLAAYLRAHPTDAPVTLHVIDDAQIGAGRVWDTHQTRTLCMNTLAGAVTLFTEPGATVSAPVLEGPTMYEWIQLLRGEAGEINQAKRSLFSQFPPEVPEQFSAEIAATRPESNPSRALYGEYLRWVWRVAKSALPDNVAVVEHSARVVGIKQVAGHDELLLDDATSIPSSATVLATGWVLPALPEVPDDGAGSGLTHITANNPVEQDVAELRPGERVLVRGLGMGFFDLMALVTIDRGGRFVPDASSAAGMRYEASGDEPHLIATSGRGYPYLPKSEYRSLPPKANLARLRAAIETAAESSDPVSFGRDLWPALARDAYGEFYRTAAEKKPEAMLAPLDEVLRIIDSADLASVATGESVLPVADALTAALDGVVDTDVVEPFDMAYWVDPLAGTEGASVKELGELIATGMARDIAEAQTAWDSPLKAGLWAISAGRKPVAIATENGKGAPERALSQYMAFGQMVGSGPPLFRTQELLALYEAGLVTFLGPKPAVRIEGGAVAATSGNRTAEASAVADAFLPSPDVRRTADPLTISLIDSGRVRPFAPSGLASAAPETDAETRRTVHPDGFLDDRLHIVGIPTGKQWADTTISPMPGTDPLMLQETDKAAHSLLRAAGLIG